MHDVQPRAHLLGGGEAHDQVAVATGLSATLTPLPEGGAIGRLVHQLTQPPASHFDPVLAPDARQGFAAVQLVHAIDGNRHGGVGVGHQPRIERLPAFFLARQVLHLRQLAIALQRAARAGSGEIEKQAAAERDHNGIFPMIW